MAIVDINYDPEEAKNAAESGGGNLPIGWYIVTVVATEIKPPKDAGKYPMLRCQVQIQDSFNRGRLGVKRWAGFSFHPKSVPYNLQRMLKAAGVQYQDIGNGQLRFDTDHLIGATFKADVKHRAGDSATFEDWDNFEPAGGAAAPAAFGAPAGFVVQQPQAMQPAMAPQQGFAPPAQPMQAQPMQSFPQQPGYPAAQQPQQYAAPQAQPMPQQQFAPVPQQGFAPPNGNGQPAQQWPAGWPQQGPTR